MPLSHAAVQQAKPAGKSRRLYDTGGLCLQISPSGARLWRFKYRFGGKAKMLSLGTFPAVSLAEARRRRDEARKMLATGVNPSAARKAAKVAAATADRNTLGAVTAEWVERFSARWSEGHVVSLHSRLRHVLPQLGGRPIAAVSPAEILAVLRNIEARGSLETAHRVRSILGQVFRFAIASGRAERDPTVDLRGALPPAKVEHFAAPLDPGELGRILRAIRSCQATPVVAAALKLAPMLFVRPGELRALRWQDIDFAAAEWRFVASKTGQAHIVPLPKQAVAILRDLRPLTGLGTFAFPNARDRSRPMSENSLTAALRRLGVDKTAATLHGFRATARTLLVETLGFPPHLVEHQLAHAVRDPNGRAYNRCEFLPERRAMLQVWSDHIHKLAADAAVGGAVVELEGA